MKTSCFTIAALLIAACLFVPSYSVRPKPGICPKVFNTLLPVPPCDYDNECPGDEKCCRFDYGSVCAPPFTTPHINLIKPGHCPKYFESFTPLKQCHYDRDFPGADKCCVFDWGYGCAPPIPSTLKCPPPRKFGPCFEGCFGGCKNGQICCFNGCGHQCMTPVAGPCGRHLFVPHCHDGDGECSSKKRYLNRCGNTCERPFFFS